MTVVDSSKTFKLIKNDNKIRQKCISMFGLNFANSDDSNFSKRALFLVTPKRYKNKGFGSFSASPRASRGTIC